MKKLIFLLTFSFIFTACDSPMNHRVNSDGGNQKNLEIMKFENYPLQVQVQWLTGPVGNIQSKNQLMVIIRDEEGKRTSLSDGLSLNFYATMPSMGHPMDDAGFFEELSPGIYLNVSIGYNMPGDWKNELWIMDSEYNIKDKVVWHEFF